MLPSPHLVPFFASRQIYSEAENTRIKAVGIFFFLLRDRKPPQWAACSGGVLARHPVFVTCSCSPSPNHGKSILKNRTEKSGLWKRRGWGEEESKRGGGENWGDSNRTTMKYLFKKKEKKERKEKSGLKRKIQLVVTKPGANELCASSRRLFPRPAPSAPQTSPISQRCFCYAAGQYRVEILNLSIFFSYVGSLEKKGQER